MQALRQNKMQRYALKADSITADHVRLDFHASVLADIYQGHINLAAWQRQLNSDIHADIKQLLSNKALFNYRVVISPEEVEQWLKKEWTDTTCKALIQDIHQLTAMFADLFELEKVGLRLELVNKTVCPYFHVDKVIGRLVTTYFGPTTEWLPETNTNRDALEQREYSSIMRDEAELQHATVGDVMLFKGESWPDRGVESIVHRSPECPSHQRRLLLTLDML